ncbi:FtsQ-type POTRA domain-containing protein [Fodinicola feengrottensis]|uniref:FtsQ-type POTRA domain-containing protein n=1 Tax=Fodinicola feengrottensis TaxID=435914 RepID=A0ABP4TRF9_9ACTN
MKTAGTPRRESWRVVHEQDQTRRTDDLQSVADRIRAGHGRLGRWHRLIAWTSVLAVLLLAGGGAWLIYGTKVLDVQTISVVGAQTVDTGAIVDAAGIQRGAALSHVDLAAAQRRLLTALPPLASAAISRSWPHTVVISVRERVAVAVVSPGYREIDSTGVVFRTMPSRPAGLPVLSLANPGPKDPSTAAALTVSQALSPALKSQVASITAPSPSQVTLNLTGGRTVVWGDASQSEEKAAVLAVLLKRPGKKYDVSAPSVVTVR